MTGGGDMTVKILQWSLTTCLQFAEKYEEARTLNADIVEFQGNELAIGYAYYLLEHLHNESRGKVKKPSRPLKQLH